MDPVVACSHKIILALLFVSLFVSIVTASCGLQDSPLVPAAGLGDQKPAPATRPRPAKNRGSTPFDNVHSGLRDMAGNLWFGTTSEGVYRYDGKSLTELTEKDGLSSNRVYLILEDRSGRIWFGTDAGACSYDGKSFTRLSIPEPNGRKTGVSCIFQDKAGGMWFGTGSGVYRYDGKVVTSLLSDAAVVNPNRL